eukprot:UN00688
MGSMRWRFLAFVLVVRPTQQPDTTLSQLQNFCRFAPPAVKSRRTAVTSSRTPEVAGVGRERPSSTTTLYANRTQKGKIICNCSNSVCIDSTS